jgi:hypothetical protein
MAARGGDYISDLMGRNTGVAGGVPRQVQQQQPTQAATPAQPTPPRAPAQQPITPQNVDSISSKDPRFNGTEYINALNAAHPEYSGKPAAPTFDASQQVGHNGKTTEGLTREQYRDAWVSSGAKSMDDLNRFIAAHGGKLVSGNGTVMTPFGEQIDMLINARGSASGQGSASAGWGGIGGPAKPAATPAMPAAAGGASAGGASVMSAPAPAPAGLPATPAAPVQDPQIAGLINDLTTRAHQTLNLNPNDPIIKNQVDAYSAQSQRARRDYLADTAEKNSPYASGAQRGEERMTAEKLGQDTSGFQAELMGRELTARRQEIQSALDSMGNLLTEEQRQALQRELAAADNSLKKYGIDTQNNQYFAGLSQNDRQFVQQLAQQGRLADAENGFRYAQLGQDNSHFLDNMGFQTADRQAYWDAVHSGQLGG